MSSAPNELAQRLVRITSQLSSVTEGRIEDGFKGIKILTFRRTDKHSNMCALLLNEDQSPKCVVKFARYADSQIARESILTEITLFEILKERNLGGYCPVLLGRNSVDPEFFVTSYVDAKDLVDIIPDNLNREFFEAQYIANNNFLLALKNKGVWSKDELVSYFENSLTIIENEFPDRDDLVQLSRVAIERVSGASLPRVIWHNEFNPYNVKVKKDGQICVLDWEDCEIDGFPGFDHFNYLLVYLAELRRCRSDNVKDFLSVAVFSIKDYFSKLGISEEMQSDLFRLFSVHRTAFFLCEKRHEKEYARGWLSCIEDKNWWEIVA